MRNNTPRLLIVCITIAFLAASAWAQPEVRAYHGAATGQFVTYPTNAAGEWNWAVIRPTAAAASIVQRFISLSPTDTGNRAIGDVGYLDAGGGAHGRYYIGRPLHPGLPIRLQGSSVTAGLQVQFRVMAPGSSRPMGVEAKAGTGSTNAQIVDGAGTLVNTDNLTTSILGNQLQLYTNPMLATDGDELKVFVYAEGTPGTTTVTRVAIAIYSRLYGWDFYLDTNKDGAASPGNFFGPVPGGSNTLISNSGAYRIVLPISTITFPVGGFGKGAVLVDFGALHSNEQCIPGPQDMLASPGADDTVNFTTDPHRCWSQVIINSADWTAVPRQFPCWTVGANPVNDYDPMTAPGAGDLAQASPTPAYAKPLNVPVGCTGIGRTSLQTRQTATPGNLVDNPAGVYYRTGAEWQYATGGTVSNANLAAGTPTFAAAPSALGETSFLSSRVNVPMTGDTWIHSDGVTSASVENGTDSLPCIIAGTHAGSQVYNAELAPGTVSPARRFQAWNTQPPGGVLWRCPVEQGGCGAMFTAVQTGNVCPYDGVALEQITTDDPPSAVAGDAGKVYRCADILTSALPCSYAGALPGLALMTGVAELSHGNIYSIPPASVSLSPPELGNSVVDAERNTGMRIWPSSNAASAANLTVQITIPPHQPPSVLPLTGNCINNYATDCGYRGTFMAYDDLCTSRNTMWRVLATPLSQAGKSTIPVAQQPPVGAIINQLPPDWDPTDPTLATQVTRVAFPGNSQVPFADNGQWDQFYHCPDCGATYPMTGPGSIAPGQPCRAYTFYWVAVGVTGGYRICPGHWWCPVCGNTFGSAQVSPTTPVCPFDGSTLVAANNQVAPNVIQDRDAQAEDFDAFDVLTSVERKADMAATQPVVDLGRVSPGVADAGALSPDTTVAGTYVAPAKPLGSDVSRIAPYPMLNDGNVQAPGWLYAAQATAGYTRDQLLTRPDFDVTRYARERLVGLMAVNSGPWQTGGGTLFPFTSTGGAQFAQNAALALNSQVPGDPTAVSHWMNWQAGLRSGALTKPLPMALPVGLYGGRQYMFVDTLANGSASDGYLKFWQRSTNTNTSTNIAAGGAPFDPENDVPLEPVFTYDVRMRVAETRTPYNDYYALDASPTARFDSDATGDYMQLIWATNRASLSNASTPPALNAAAPAGTGPAAIARPDWPINLAYANATRLPADPNDPYYAGWAWNSPNAQTITSTSVAAVPASAGTVNASPFTYTFVDSSGNRSSWLAWHQRLNHAGGSQSTFEFGATTTRQWGGSGHIYSTGLPKEHIRGFAEALNSHWYFWDSGANNQRDIWYRWRFDPTATAIDSHESPLPVYNSIGRDVRNDIAQGIDGRSVKKPSHSPFVYTQMAHPVPMVASDGTPLVSVFFSGYARSTQSADICWVQFNRDQLADPGNWRTNNWGKRTFARIWNNTSLPAIGTTGPPNNTPISPGEEFKGDGGRQVFNSRHLDWQVYDNGAGADFGRNYASAAWNPAFYIGIVRDTPGDGLPPAVQMYQLTWTSTQDAYNRARGTYTVTPTPVPLNGAPALPANCVMTLPGGALALRDPNAAQAGQDRPVTLEIDPAAGSLRFSAPLFNVDNAADPTCVLNTARTGWNDTQDALVYGDYTPYVYRVTNAGGSDDSPSAFWEGGALQRLVVFWRRNYSSTQTPHNGRSAVMCKVWRLGAALHYPPLQNNSLTLSPVIPVADYTLDQRNGTVSFAPQYQGMTFAFGYNDAAGNPHVEWHTILGWSRDIPVPTNSVTAEGPLTVTAEPYQYTVNGTVFDAIRYWLFWASPRPIYDVRPTVNNGQGVHQSADTYDTSFTPPFDNLPREVETGSVNRSPT